MTASEAYQAISRGVRAGNQAQGKLLYLKSALGDQANPWDTMQNAENQDQDRGGEVLEHVFRNSDKFTPE